MSAFARPIPAILTTLAVLLSLASPAALASEAPEKVPMAKFCAGCHQPAPGIMMGFLDSISTIGQFIQMDFITHKDLVMYTDETEIKNLASFDQIDKYRRKGFKIRYEEQDGQKWATEIARFDILKTVAEDEKLTKEAFKAQLADEAVAVYDVRPPMPYQAAHVPGARSLPAPAFEKLAHRLPVDKNTPIVFYGPGGCLSPTTSLRAKGLGYTNVKIYAGGFADWVKGEYTVTGPDWLRKSIAAEIPMVLVDLRPEETARQSHIPGAVSAPLDQIDSLRERLPEQKDAPIVLYGEGKEAAARQIASWGYGAVRVLPIEFAEWAADGPVETGQMPTQIAYTPRPKPGTVTTEEFSAIANEVPADRMLVDVRNPDEVAEGALRHAVNIPTDQLRQRLDELPPDREPVFFCRNGIRAEMAYYVVTNAGRKGHYLDASIRIDPDGRFRFAAK